MNVFQQNYESRLSRWRTVREEIKDSDIAKKCVEIDKFWQQVPVVNHYLHTRDVSSWPGPWDLLVENTYCDVARALGICYTLYLSGVEDVEMVEAIDMQGNEVVLVLVDDAKYVLNYWPDTVLNISSTDFTIKRQIDLSSIKEKL